MPPLLQPIAPGDDQAFGFPQTQPGPAAPDETFSFEQAVTFNPPKQPPLDSPAQQFVSRLNYFRKNPGKLSPHLEIETVRRTPFLGQAFHAIEALHVKGAAERMNAGQASEEDLNLVAKFIVRTERANSAPLWKKAVDMASYLPAFATEFLTTTGFYSAARASVGKAVQETALTGVKQFAASSAARAAGVAAQTLANPQLAARNAAETAAWRTIRKEDKDGFWENLPRGYGQAFLELAFERSGEHLMNAVKGVGRAVPGLPQAAEKFAQLAPVQKARKLKEGFKQWWLDKVPGRTVKQFDRLAKEMGYAGMLEEELEELGTDFAGGLLGVEENYGKLQPVRDAAGGLATAAVFGWDEALPALEAAKAGAGPAAKQIAAELLSFTLFPIAKAVAQRYGADPSQANFDATFGPQGPVSPEERAARAEDVRRETELRGLLSKLHSGEATEEERARIWQLGTEEWERRQAQGESPEQAAPPTAAEPTAEPPEDPRPTEGEAWLVSQPPQLSGPAAGEETPVTPQLAGGDTTGLAGMGASMGAAISDNLYESWRKSLAEKNALPSAEKNSLPWQFWEKLKAAGYPNDAATIEAFIEVGKGGGLSDAASAKAALQEFSTQHPLPAKNPEVAAQEPAAGASPAAEAPPAKPSRKTVEKIELPPYQRQTERAGSIGEKRQELRVTIEELNRQDEQLEQQLAPLRKEFDRLRSNAHKKRGKLQGEINALQKKRQQAAQQRAQLTHQLREREVEDAVEAPRSYAHELAARAELAKLRIDRLWNDQRKLDPALEAEHERYTLALQELVEAEVQDTGLQLPDEINTAVQFALQDFTATSRSDITAIVERQVQRVREQRRVRFDVEKLTHLTAAERNEIKQALNETLADEAGWYQRQQEIYQQGEEDNEAAAERERAAKVAETKRQATENAREEIVMAGVRRSKAREQGNATRFWAELKKTARRWKGTKGTVTIKGKSPQPDREEQAEILGDWAIHPGSEAGMVTLTHVPSGLAAVSAGKSPQLKEFLELASQAGLDLAQIKEDGSMPRELATALSKVVSAWDADDLSKLPDEMREKLLAGVQVTPTTVQADQVLDSFDLGVHGGVKLSTEGYAVVKELAKEVPEFAFAPVFTVSAAKQLIFQDGVTYRLRPEMFNLHPGELTPGQTVGINLEDLGIARPTETEVVAAALKSIGMSKISQRIDGTVSATWLGQKVTLTGAQKKWSVAAGMSPAHQAAQWALEKIGFAAEPRLQQTARYSTAGLVKAFNLTREEAEATDAIVQALALDTTGIRLVQGGKPAEGALLQAAAVPEGPPGPVWRDNVLEALSTWQNKGTPDQLRAHLAKQRGAKEEAEWIQLEDFLVGKQSVTRAAVEQYVQTHRVELVETTLAEDDAQFSRWKEPGSQAYREVLLRMPITEETQFRSSHYRDHENVLVHVRLTERVDTDGRRVLFVEEIQSDWHQQGRKQGYQGEGLEEIEALEAEVSVLHQELLESIGNHELGYAAFGNPARALEEIRFHGGTTTPVGREKSLAGITQLFGLDRETVDRYVEINNRLTALSLSDYRAVPEAPFKTSWPLLAFKRVLRFAAEEGYDVVGWTSGQQQVERYDLRKQISQLRVFRREDGNYDLAAQTDDGDQDLGTNVAPDKLEEVVGKELAQKIVAGEGTPDRGAGAWRSFSGLDLQVGGEGMRKFYDEILPAEVKRLIKPWGGKVEPLGMEFGRVPTRERNDFTLEEAEQLVLVARNNEDVWGLPEREAKEAEAVLAAMRTGQTFDSAMRNHGSAPLRQMVFGYYTSSVPNGQMVHSVALTPATVKAALDGLPLFQGEQGAAEFAKDGTAILRGLQAANVSTGLHEIAHVVRRQLLNRNVPDEQRAGITLADIQTAEEWAEVAKGNWTREAEEKFARGFERYLRDGQAPASGLRKLFAKLSDWFAKIYETITGGPLDVEISSPMRKLFDKLVTRRETLADQQAETEEETSPEAEPSEGEAADAMLDEELADATGGKPRERRRHQKRIRSRPDFDRKAAEGAKAGDVLRPIPMPELFRLAKELLSSGAPLVTKQTGSAWGTFVYRSGSKYERILINPKAAGDEVVLGMVLAHETGHLIDYLPDRTLARGNLLGRLGSLRGYLKKFLAGYPGGPGPLTDEERQRIRKEVAKLLGKQATREIEREIVDTMPITPEDVKAIWNSVDTSHLPPALLDYVKRLSAAAKMSIVKEALKGRVAAELQQFAKTVPTGRFETVTETLFTAGSREEIAAEYKRLIEEEIRKRHLLSVDVITPELIALSEWWRPYNKATATRKHIKYRESAHELYADALSVLLNTPGELAERAPEFYRGLLAYLDTKPEFLREYLELQALLDSGSEEIAAARTASILEMFAGGEEAIRAAEQARRAARQDIRETVRQYLGQYMLDRLSPIKRRARLAENAAAEYTLDELFRSENANHVFLNRLQQGVLEPLRAEAISDEDIGQYLFLHRIINDRNELANPIGFVPSAAAEQIDALQARLGADRYQLLRDKVQRFHDLVFSITRKAMNVGAYNSRTFYETIEPNRDTYSAFAVVKYLEDRIPASIRQQVGTFEEVANPLTATVLKIISLNRLIELQKAKNVTIELLKKSFKKEIRRVPLKHDQREPGKPARPGFEYLATLEDGKLRYYEVPIEIAKSFQMHDIGGLARLGNLLQSAVYKVWHPLFVTFNPGFAVANPFRDLRRTHRLLGAIGSAKNKQLREELIRQGKSPEEAKELASEQNITLGQLLGMWIKSAPIAWRRARGIDDPVIDEMMSNRALDTPFVDVESLIEEGKVDRLLHEYGLHKDKQKLHKHRTATGKFLRKFLAAVEGAGVFTETLTKVAGYQLLKERGVAEQERAHITRKYVGTPDYKQRGLATPVTNSLWMYSKVRWNGLQAEAEIATGSNTAAGYWWRTLLTTIAPKTLTTLALLGFFGPYLKKLFERISRRFRDDYDVLPIGLVNDGGEEKTVFLSIPLDDVSSFLGAVWGRLLQTSYAAAGGDTPEGSATQAASSTVGEAWAELMPNWNPLLDLVGKWGQFLSDRNPHDDFAGKNVVPDDEWDAGGWDATRKMLAWSFDKFGVVGDVAKPITGLLLGTSYDPGTNTTLETTVRSLPGISRLLRVSSHGLTEQEYAALENEEREEKRFKLGLPKHVQNLSRDRYLLMRRGPQNGEEELRDKVLDYWYSKTYLPLTKSLREAKGAGYDQQATKFSTQLDQESAAVVDPQGKVPAIYLAAAVHEATDAENEPRLRGTVAWQLLQREKVTYQQAREMLYQEEQREIGRREGTASLRRPAVFAKNRLTAFGHRVQRLNRAYGQALFYEEKE